MSTPAWHNWGQNFLLEDFKRTQFILVHTLTSYYVVVCDRGPENTPNRHKPLLSEART